MAQTPCLVLKEGSVVEHTAAADIIAGQVVVTGSIPMIATSAISSGDKGSLESGGQWKVPQAAEIITAGDSVYWDDDGNPYGGTEGTGCATATATNNTLMGECIETTTATTTYVKVLLTAAKRTATIAGAVTATDITGSDSSLAIAGIAGNAGAGGAIVGAGGAGDGNAAGGAVSWTGGAGAGTGSGGAASLVGGAAGTTGDGGAIAITGGAGPTAGNTGGAVTILSGAGDGTNGTAGAVIIDSSGTGATKGAVTIATNAASLTFGKMPRIPVTAVNAAGANLATAGALAEGFNLVAASDNTKGVQLPSCVDGAQCIVVNMVTDKTLKIYPPTGKQVNLAGANTAITVAANTVGIYVSEGANAWYGLHAATDVA